MVTKQIRKSCEKSIEGKESTQSLEYENLVSNL